MIGVNVMSALLSFIVCSCRRESARRLLACVAACLLLPVGAFAATYGYASTTLGWINNASHTDVTWGGASQCSGGWNSTPVDDDLTAPINIGFAFTFGATAYTTVKVMSNGRLEFGTSTYCGYGTETIGPPPTYPYPYPDANMNNTMRVYGADFCPGGAAAPCAGRVTYAQLGTAPYRSFVVTWSQMKEWNSGSSLFNVQMILYESGDFVYQYKDIANISQGVGQVGYQLTSTDYVLVDETTVNSLAYSAIRFFKPTAPIAEYRFDECSIGAANTVLDSSGNSLHGTPTGGVTTGSSGIICTAFNFNGSNGYIAVSDNALLNPPYVSVAAWVRHNTASFKTWETILAKGDTTYRLHLNGGCSINGITTGNAFTFGFNAGCGNADLNSGIVPVAGQWYHVVGTYDGVTIKIFVNGVLTNSQALSTTIGINTYPLYLGENAQQTGRYWSGDIDEVKIFNRALPDNEVLSMYANESQGLQRDGSLRLCAACNAALGNFNAFDTSMAAGSVTGVIRTKIAGLPLASSTGNIDVVALNAGALTPFTGNATVQFLDAHDNSGAMDAKGCRSSWTLISMDAGLSAFTFAFSGQNRLSLPAIAPVNAWPEVRVKVINASTTANYGCSNDAFAIRPSYLNISGATAKDANWLSAGTTRALTNTAASGGNVHAAGTPFSLGGLVAMNAAGVTASNYQGQPVLVPGNLILPDPAYCDANGYTCVPGSFNVASWGYASGTLSSTTATYSDAGAFSWEVEDRTFAKVDMADSTKSQRYFRSNAVINTGRFVPASYQLVLNTPALQTFGSACGVRSFTYLGQPFGYATTPAVGVTAMNGTAAPAATHNYLGAAAGGLWKLASSMAYSSATCTAPTQTCALIRQSGTTRFTTSYALGTATPGWDGSNLAAQIGNATIASSNNGAGTLGFGSTDKLVLFRDPITPGAPYTAAVTLALQLDDYSEAGALPATCASAPSIAGNPTCISGILAATPLAFDAGSTFRYGRLRLGNAYGSELLDLPIPLEAQYWDAGGYYVSNAGDSCTSFNVSSIILAGFTQNLAACETQLAPSGSQTLVGGRLPLRLTRPGANNDGSVNLVLNVGAAAAGSTCVTGAATPATAANMPWFGNTNPTGRASFGVYKTPLIFRRENY